MIRAANVGLEGGQGGTLGCANNGLRCQMEDGLDLVFVDHPFDQCHILQTAMNAVDLAP